MRSRDRIMRELKQGMGGETNVARNQLVLAEILLDIREELIKNRGLYYLAMAPNLSDKMQRDLAKRISKEILKKEA